MNSKKIEFILFVDPLECQFYSYSMSAGLLVRENAPEKFKKLAKEQIRELELCLEHPRDKPVTTYQQRGIPSNFILESKFKFPVYYTDEYLPPSTLQQYSSDGKEELLDHIYAKIHLGEIESQINETKREVQPESVSIDIKLISSLNEVVRTINRVVLQEYGIVIATKNQKNKLIFKVKDREEYLYGNETISNFVYIRECIADRRIAELEIIEASIYEREQFTIYLFQRDASDVEKGEYAGFPWEEFDKKNPEGMELLMWHLPSTLVTNPKALVSLNKLYSLSELARVNEQVKLKLEEARRFEHRNLPRFIWKYKMMEFLERRRIELKKRYVEVDGPVVIYSGECSFLYDFNISGINNLFKLFIPKTMQYKNRSTRRKFLNFFSKEMFIEGSYPIEIPSSAVRYMQFTEIKKNGLFPLQPYMCTLAVEMMLGCKIFYRQEVDPFTAYNHSGLDCKVQLGLLSKLPLETCLVFTIKVHSKEGDGIVCGIGVLKLFDEFGFLRQGCQEIQLHSTESIEPYKIGCLDKTIQPNSEIAQITVTLPKFRHAVIWTLHDPISLKLLGYYPQHSDVQPAGGPNLEKLYELLNSDALALYKYTKEDKDLLRKCKKFYKHQSYNLINYLFAIDWEEPSQVTEVYSVLHEWSPLKPIEALFLLTPMLPDEKIRYYAVKYLEGFLDYEFVLYSNQLTQALVSFETHCNPLIDLLLEKCICEPLTVGHEYFWQFKNRLTETYTADRFYLYLETLLMTTSLRKNFLKEIMINNQLIVMNEKLIKQTEGLSVFAEKNKQFVAMLAEIEESFRLISERGFFFPIRPQCVFKGFAREECKMYDSKKLPFCLACIPGEVKPKPKPPKIDQTQPTSRAKHQPTKHLISHSSPRNIPSVDSATFNPAMPNETPPYKIMFKYGDDIKQDHLVLQLFRVFDRLWCQANLDLKMTIYRVLSTGPEIGFIEIVDAENNSKIHKEFGRGLMEAFDEKTTFLYLQAYNEDRKQLQEAKDNYKRSCAGYLVATYVMGIGDRHSGNVMVQKNGKFFHIDFGHILGNFKTKFNIKRERTPVLFTSEFLYVMGGLDSNEFADFLKLCARAFNILRSNSSLILNLLIMMVSAEIPQLKSLVDIEYVSEKLELGLSDQQAGEKLTNIIKETLLSEKSRNLDNAFHEINRVG